MASILPDDILNKLLCSTCKKYLSYGPTKIHRNGRISCGRCNSNETTSPNSLYEKVAKFSLFPCINRYEGCNKLLQYKDVAEHEKICKSTQYSCPMCTSDQPTQMSLLYVIEHYKTEHEEYYLKEPKFEIYPNTMSQSTYLYCDNSTNSLVLINVGCTRDRVFLNASVPKNNKIVQRFRLNDVLLEPNKVMLCSQLLEPKLQYYEVKMGEIPGEQQQLISCEFLYDVIDKTAPVVVLDLNSVDEPTKREPTYRKLPKIYLDNKIFRDKQKYKLSPCKSKLINECDSNFNVKLKCDSCDTYFWNVPDWRKIVIEENVRQYGLYYWNYSDELICLLCYLTLYSYGKVFKATMTEPIFKFRFYCRYDCGMICPIWDFLAHEQGCKFNLEKNCDEFVKKCFGETSHDASDIFVIGNVVKSFQFEVAVYPFAIFGPEPKVRASDDIVSTERVIYLITDDGLKCKVFCKYKKGSFCCHVEHDYDTSRYSVKIHIEDFESPYSMAPREAVIQEIMYVEKRKSITVGSKIRVKNESFGVCQYINTPRFIVIIKRISPSCNVTL